MRALFEKETHKKVVELTDDISQYWKETIWSEIMKNHNVFDCILQYDHQTQRIHHLLYSEELKIENRIN